MSNKQGRGAQGVGIKQGIKIQGVSSKAQWIGTRCEQLGKAGRHKV